MMMMIIIIQRQMTRKWYNIRLYLQWPTNRNCGLFWYRQV